MRRTDRASLAAALLTCLCFGSIHAYGVLLVPIEREFGTSRAIASLGYALALAALTAAVWLNGRFAPLLRDRTRLILSAVIAALGLTITAAAAGPWSLLAGFGLLFGLGNGFAYAHSLSLAAAAMPGRETQAMGLATAVYGLGAVVSAQIFGALIETFSVPAILMGLAAAMLLVSGLSAILLKTRTPSAPARRAEPEWRAARGLLPIWVAYLLSAFAGLMVIAHALAIAVWRGAESADAGLAPALVSFGSVAGGYLGGVLTQALPGRASLIIPAAVQAVLLAGLTLPLAPVLVFADLLVVGLCYGVLIAAVPAVVLRLSGARGFARDYGLVFTAWGVAGVAGPVTAGYLYDATGGYGPALIPASLMSLCAVAVLMRMPS